MRAVPTYDVSPIFALRGAAAALATAAVGGVVVQFAAGLLPFGLIGLLLYGLGLGMGVARVVGLATNRKRGPLLGWLTVIAITLGYCLSRSALIYLQLGMLQEGQRLAQAIAVGFRLDLGVLLLLIAAGVMAYGRLN